MTETIFGLCITIKKYYQQLFHKETPEEYIETKVNPMLDKFREDYVKYECSHIKFWSYDNMCNRTKESIAAHSVYMQVTLDRYKKDIYDYAIRLQVKFYGCDASVIKEYPFLIHHIYPLLDETMRTLGKLYEKFYTVYQNDYAMSHNAIKDVTSDIHC